MYVTLSLVRYFFGVPVFRCFDVRVFIPGPSLHSGQDSVSGWAWVKQVEFKNLAYLGSGGIVAAGLARFRHVTTGPTSGF